jgi:ActR/RegA family two-component response regulator
MSKIEYLHAQRVLQSVNGNKSQAARILEIDRKTLERILNQNKE